MDDRRVERIHGTMHQKPSERFARDEKAVLRSLPSRPLPRRRQMLQQRVAHDALVEVDTVRYSVPHGLVREHVEVQLGDEQVRAFNRPEGSLFLTPGGPKLLPPDTRRRTTYCAPVKTSADSTRDAAPRPSQHAPLTTDQGFRSAV
jgi:hypothetical protein